MQNCGPRQMYDKAVLLEHYILSIKKSMNPFSLILLLSIFMTFSIIYLAFIFKYAQNYLDTIKLSAFASLQSNEEYNENFTKLIFDLKQYSLKSNDQLKEKLFPWLIHSNLTFYTGQQNSKGIVICTGNRHIQLTLVALKSLELIENELPIEVFYSSSNDLSLENQGLIKKSFPEVNLIDLSLTSFNDSYLHLRGWEIKPFAVLASRFSKVLLMDADVLFFEQPSTLFNNNYFIKSGTLFFYDRPTLPYKTIQWINTFSSYNDPPLPIRTQESGVVLIDKSRVLKGLLSVCKLNDHDERKRFTYKYFYGDKDTWWLGFHIIQMSYSFIPTLTASIGKIDNVSKNKVCGHILHLDESNKPVWWNGGMFRNRYLNKELINIDGWLKEGSWIIEYYSCLTNNEQIAEQFNQYHQYLINGYREITKLFFNIS